MLRTVNAQPTLWEALLPEACLGLPAELAAVDELLDDPVFFEPFRAYFHDRLGRPSVPIETYLRLMFLKYRYRLGFEPLCREVADSISWQRFARIPLGATVPHPTTLMKITTRCGPTAVEGLNEALLAKAHAGGVARMAKTIRRIQAAGLAGGTVARDRTRAVHRRARDIAANLRRRTDAAKEEVRAINADLIRIAERAVAEARAVVRHARRGQARTGAVVSVRACAAVDALEATAQRVERIAAQTRLRITGTTPEGSTRLVSLHDPDARPIAKGRLAKPVEFGYKAQVVDNDDGIVLDHNGEAGNPADAPMLAPAIERITARVGRPPRAVAADRGYGEAAVEAALTKLGVRTVVLPTKGKPSAARRAIEQRRSFQRLVKWRTGSEGRISCLKRDFGWNRTRIDGLAGARTWCGHGVFNHNLVKIAALTTA